MLKRLAHGVMLMTAATLTVAAQVNVTPTIVLPPLTGSDTFKHFCASCHGADARGNGPLASQLRRAPSDLTALASSNGGRFPRERVQELLSHDRADAPAHGTTDMPVWGPIFRGLEPEARGQARIDAVVGFLQSIQAH